MVKFRTNSIPHLLAADSSTASNISASSVKINPTASIVLSFSKGGNTATGCKPNGSKANESATVVVTIVGKPPPPIAPTGIEPTGGEPGGCKKEKNQY